MAEKHVYDGSASCGGCDTRWTGFARAHCAVCHRTFGGPSLFDAHRRDKCIDPETIMTTPRGSSTPQRLMFLVDGIWQTSEERVDRSKALREWRAAQVAV